jgi:hypothetical protein
MFEKLKNQIGTLEDETAQLKSELAKVRIELAETKRIFSKLAGENQGLREENTRLIKLGLAPAYPIVKRHQWPDDFAAKGETRQESL